jgi:enoyl-CoA hydratase
MGYQHLEVTVDGAVATLWLNRPVKMNAVSQDMWDDIPDAMADLNADNRVRSIIVAGRGPAFTVGIDLELLARLENIDGSPAEQSRRIYDLIRRFQETNNAFADSPKPTIAAIHGYCLGEGISLATACDIRLATADAQISIRETRMGLVADVGVLQRLPSIIGFGHTAELAFTGKDIDGNRAAAIGLVNRVYPDHDSLMEGARELADEIASVSPLVVAGVKEVLAANRGRDLDQALDYVAMWNSAHLLSDDLREALAAFTEKRNPAFKGT